MDLAGVPTELAGLGSSINTMLDRLEDAFAQQVRFTADASHELRTPLAVLSSHLELALSRPRSPEEYRAALDTCRRAAKRMQSLTDGLLVLARADAGKLELQPERIDLAAIADEAVGLFAGLARQHNVSLAAHARPAEIDADPDRVHQIVANLIANAIQHNRPGGSVVVSTEATADHALLRVADTGAGIPADALPHVFGRFYRVDVARSRDHGGSGLGLAIVKELADAHGAEVAMASEPGRGTTVSITWPRPADA
jgi:signal transduction histidine kinase